MPAPKIDFRAIHCAGWKRFYVDPDNDSLDILRQAEDHNDYLIANCED